MELKEEVRSSRRRIICLSVALAVTLTGLVIALALYLTPYLVRASDEGSPLSSFPFSGLLPSGAGLRCISDHASQGPCTTTAHCCVGCCSRYGWCGTTSEHCGEGCQSTCGGGGGGGSGDAVSWETMKCGFTNVGPGESRLREIHQSLNSAVKKMGISFGESVSKVEVAAFLGQISHESDYLRAKREYCSLPEYGSTCIGDYDNGSWCPQVKPAPGKHYYGRGWIQLTWNCNYDAAGKYLGRNFLADPDQVERSDQIAWEATFWYWTVNKIYNPARSSKFGETTRLINGGECNGGNNNAQQSRINRYQAMRKCLGLPTESNANNLWC